MKKINIFLLVFLINVISCIGFCGEVIISGGDNLGNHKAIKDLNMQKYSIKDTGEVFVDSITLRNYLVYTIGISSIIFTKSFTYNCPAIRFSTTTEIISVTGDDIRLRGQNSFMGFTNDSLGGMISIKVGNGMCELRITSSPAKVRATGELEVYNKGMSVDGISALEGGIETDSIDTYSGTDIDFNSKNIVNIDTISANGVIANIGELYELRVSTIIGKSPVYIPEALLDFIQGTTANITYIKTDTIDVSTINTIYMYVSSYSYTVILSSYIKTDRIEPYALSKIGIASDMDFEGHNIENCYNFNVATTTLQNNINNEEMERKLQDSIIGQATGQISNDLASEITDREGEDNEIKISTGNILKELNDYKTLVAINTDTIKVELNTEITNRQNQDAEIGKSTGTINSKFTENVTEYYMIHPDDMQGNTNASTWVRTCGIFRSNSTNLEYYFAPIHLPQGATLTGAEFKYVRQVTDAQCDLYIIAVSTWDWGTNNVVTSFVNLSTCSLSVPLSTFTAISPINPYKTIDNTKYYYGISWVCDNVSGVEESCFIWCRIRYYKPLRFE